ncbi:MAG TPA: hypothetical protein VGD67_04745 [Pseudonocardiaceae bacterium]
MSPKPVAKSKRGEPIIKQSPVVKHKNSRVVILPGGVGTISAAKPRSA